MLLASDSVLLVQSAETLVVALGIFQDNACFLNAGIRHRDIRLGGRYDIVHGIFSLTSIVEIGLGLCHTIAELGIFNNDERITFLHLGVFLKADLFDKALYARVDRYDVLLDLSVLGKFYIA